MEEVVAVWFKILPRHLPRDTEGKHEKTSFKIAGLQAEIWTRDIPNAKLEC
jgi:hypothetical protein